MSKILLIFIANLLCIPAFCQEYFNKRFEFGQPGIWDGATTVIELPDGYVIGGGTGTPGDEFWHRVGFYKIDFQGNKIFSKLYGDTTAEYYIGNPGSIIRYDDSIVFAVGSMNTYSSDWTLQEGLLYKLTNSFDTVFCKHYGDKISPNDTDYQFEQVKVSGSNIIIVGGKKPYGLATRAILIKANSQGSLIWEKFYGSGSYSYYQGHSVICTNDGGYAIGGFLWSPTPPPNCTGDPVVVKTDSAGNQQWLKVFGGSYYDTQGMICNTLDGNMVMAYAYCDWMIGSNSFRRINLIKLDNAGNVIWNKKYGESTYEKTLLNIRENSDGSLITSGITHLAREYSSKDLGWIMKTSANGDSLWYREYDVCKGEESDNWLYDVIQTQDNGYLACGVVYPKQPDTGSQDAWVLKVDSLGCVSPGDCWVGTGKELKPVENEMVVFPNPATDKVRVQLGIRNEELGINEELRILVYDVFGREVEEIRVPAGRDEITMDVSGWPKGMYVIRLVYNNETISGKKILVQ